jgi:hypothetical protein
MSCVHCGGAMARAAHAWTGWLSEHQHRHWTRADHRGRGAAEDELSNGIGHAPHGGTSSACATTTEPIRVTESTSASTSMRGAQCTSPTYWLEVATALQRKKLSISRGPPRSR